MHDTTGLYAVPLLIGKAACSAGFPIPTATTAPPVTKYVASNGGDLGDLLRLPATARA